MEKDVVEVRELTADVSLTRFNEILALYGAVGWTNYIARPDTLRAGYEGSLAAWGAFAGDKLVGVVRVVGDGVTIVFVQDLIVAPSHQRRGIGAQLMQAVMNRFSDVYQMELLTDDGSGACALYERLGFVRSDAMGCVSYVRVAVGSGA
ncbi:GNAT family N-acetyltransferase [Olsenella sp. An285]|uniref:GNAT family N-acetyltransferase n=1 Tax=Olsenella sp. An285 TaxID=1965621 RepID=UPI0019D1E527|nr:GNAT family N-acetyltransferase [Olsenella sp. An285]